MIFTGRLVRNISGLGVLQAMNLFVTFLTLPYLTRVLGLEAWGNIVFALLVVNYCVWLTNWGFYLGATQRISACRDHGDLLSKIACEVWIAQCILTIISIIILSLFIIFFAERSMRPLYISGITILIGNLITPLWFLHGLEKVWEASLILLLAKILTLPFIFLFINHADDASLYIQLNGLGSVFAGIISLYWMYKSAFFKWRRPKIKSVLRSIGQDASIFVTSMVANITGSIIPNTLGILAGSSDLGLFNIADRIKAAAITIFHPVVHALYPRMAYLFAANKLAAVELLRISGIAIFFASLAVSSILFAMAPQLILWIGGASFSDATDLLKILALVPLVSTISAFIVHQVLIPLQKNVFYLVSTIIILITTLVLVYPNIIYFGVRGAAMTMLIAELLGCISLVLFMWFLRGSIGKSNACI